MPHLKSWFLLYYLSQIHTLLLSGGHGGFEKYISLKRDKFEEKINGN